MSVSSDSLIHRVQLSLCVVLLAGCAPLAPMPPAATAVASPASVADAPSAPAVAAAPAVVVVPAATAADLATRDMLAFHERARGLAPAELAREIARLNDAQAHPRSAVELAVLLGHTRVNGDTGRALGLLDSVVRSTAPEAAPWQPFARLVAARYGEQRRLEEQLDRQSQQARDSQRRLDQLNAKLEALKAIERNLTTQPAASAPLTAPLPAPKGSPP
jgi:hypothetical protein